MVRKNKSKFQVLSRNGNAVYVRLLVNDDRAERGWEGTVFELDSDLKRYDAPQPPFATNDTEEEIEPDNVGKK